MKYSVKLPVVLIGVVLLAGVFAAGIGLKNGWCSPTPVEAQADAKRPTPTPAPSGDSWLKGTTDEKLAQVETHLRGLDVAMAEIGYRYGELHHATKERNWEYAKYQTEKIDLALRLALERRPKRAASSQDFLNKDLPAVVQAIKSQDATVMDKAMEQLHNSCVACHRAENVLHFRTTVERIRNNARQR
ncbi:MAG: hypothetical protein AB7F88_08825 [Pyrinomonadaceae bacterium]